LLNLQQDLPVLCVDFASVSEPGMLKATGSLLQQNCQLTCPSISKAGLTAETAADPMYRILVVKESFFKERSCLCLLRKLNSFTVFALLVVRQVLSACGHVVDMYNFSQ
jgi:hypothetical protein